MSNAPQSHDAMDRLKELLFDQESREIDTLAGRIAELDKRAGNDERFRSSVATVLEGALRDAETRQHKELADALAPMVLRTLRTEMRSADMEDQISGMMFPRMGEMVRKYVSSAIRDMMQQINRRLEAGLSHNRFALWLRSLASGRSMAEMAMLDTQRLSVTEIYLVRRGSGELVHHWDKDDVGHNDTALEERNRDTLVSGFLAAITALAEEAFEADKDSLRTLDLDDHRIYIRGSPDYLLAAKCSGTAPASIESLLDQELLRVLGEHQAIQKAANAAATGNPTAAGGTADHSGDGSAPGDATKTHEEVLIAFAGRLENQVETEMAALSGGGGATLLKTLAWLVGLPLLALLGWQSYVSWHTNDLQSKVDRAIAEIPALTGYPVKAHVERGGQRIWVSGLTPDALTRRQVLGDIRSMAPAATVDEAVGVLPKPDLEAKLGAESLRLAIDRARRQLTVLARNLALVQERGPGASERTAMVAAEAAARSILGGLERIDSATETSAVVELVVSAVEQMQVAGRRIAGLIDGEIFETVTPPRTGVDGAETLVLMADRIAGLLEKLEQRRNVAPIARRIDAVDERLNQRTAEVERLAKARVETLDQTLKSKVETLDQRLASKVETLDQRLESKVATIDQRLEQRLAELERRLEQLRAPPPSAAQKLEAFIQSHAVFFATDADYRDAAATTALLDRLATLIKAAGSGVRIVGYTDEAGGLSRNQPLAQLRADKVHADLLARGIPGKLLSAIGRANGLDLAPGSGANNPNRRVQFELAFKGELGGAR